MNGLLNGPSAALWSFVTLNWSFYLFTSSLQVVAIVMDKFTDVDIFKEVVDASIRGVPVYVLLDDFHLQGFLSMAENQDVKIQQLRVSMWFGFCACCSHNLLSNVWPWWNTLIYRLPLSWEDCSDSHDRAPNMKLQPGDWGGSYHSISFLYATFLHGLNRQFKNMSISELKSWWCALSAQPDKANQM